MIVSQNVSGLKSGDRVSIPEIFTSNELLTPNDEVILLIISHSLRLEKSSSILRDNQLIDRAILELWQVRYRYLMDYEAKVNPLELMHFILLLVSDRRTLDVGKLTDREYLKSLSRLLINRASIRESALELLTSQCCNS